MDDTSKHIPRTASLDGLRGYAALAVVFYHSILHFIITSSGLQVMNSVLELSIWNIDSAHLMDRIFIALFNGETAVIIFFVLSGAVLMRQASFKSPSDIAKFSFSFIIKRFLRIFPALIACLLGFFALIKLSNLIAPSHFKSAMTLTDAILNSLLIDLKMHGATGTLRAEIFAIPLIIVAIFLRSVFGGAALMGLFAYSLMIREYPSLFIYASPAAYSWVPYFCGGFVAAHYSSTKLMQDAMSGHAWIITLFAVIMLRTVSTPFGTTSIILQTIAITLLVSGLMGGAKSSLATFLELPISQYLGKISYSFYLWAVPSFYFVGIPIAKMEISQQHHIIAAFVAGAVTTLCAIPFAHLSAKYAEKPFYNMVADRIKGRVPLQTSA